MAVAWVLVAMLGMGRRAWRFWYHNEEKQAGGSLGRQMSRRAKGRKEPGLKKST